MKEGSGGAAYIMNSFCYTPECLLFAFCLVIYLSMNACIFFFLLMCETNKGINYTKIDVIYFGMRDSHS